jgi:hypothetical protein
VWLKKLLRNSCKNSVWSSEIKNSNSKRIVCLKCFNALWPSCIIEFYFQRNLPSAKYLSSKNKALFFAIYMGFLDIIKKSSITDIIFWIHSQTTHIKTAIRTNDKFVIVAHKNRDDYECFYFFLSVGLINFQFRMCLFNFFISKKLLLYFSIFKKCSKLKSYHVLFLLSESAEMNCRCREERHKPERSLQQTTN